MTESTEVSPAAAVVGLEAYPDRAPAELVTPAPSSIWVWVCPRCVAWYGSSEMPDLATSFNRRSSMRNRAEEDASEYGKITGPRSECQRCKVEDGVTVERVLTQYVTPEIALHAIEQAISTIKDPARQVPYDRSKTPAS